MKKSLLNNFGLKILAVVLAIMLWMFVMIVSDYTVKVEIKDIPVIKQNSEIFDQLDKVYDVTSGDTVDIVVKGRRSIVTELEADDFIATADLSKMSITNTVQIEVNAKLTDINDEISITCVDNNMTLNLESKMKEQFPVKVNVTGKTKDGYAVSNTDVVPNIVTVEGPESAINKITEVAVAVAVDNRNNSFEVTRAIKLYDAYGEEINNDKIVVEQTEALTQIQIYPVKVVPLEIETVGKPRIGYDINDVICETKEVEIVGDSKNLDRIDKIVVDDLLVNGLEEDYRTNVNLNDYIPEEVKLATPNNEILVVIDVEPVTDQYLPVTASDIALINKNNEYDYEVVTPNNLRIKILGMEKKITDVNMLKLCPKIDCTNLVEGDNEAELILTDVDGVTCEVLGTVTVKVTQKATTEQQTIEQGN